MKRKANSLEALIMKNKEEIMSNEKELERIEKKIEEKHNSRLKLEKLEIDH